MNEEEQDELAQFHADRLDEWENDIRGSHDYGCTAYYAPEHKDCDCDQRPALEQIWRQRELHHQWAGISGAASAPWFPNTERVQGQIAGLFIAIQILAEAFHDHEAYKPEWRLLRD